MFFGMAKMADIARTQFYEKGGQVEGEGGVDNVHARLTKGEFVEPVDAVDHYGTGVMEAIRRKSIPREMLSNYSSMSPNTSSRFFQEGGLAVAGAEGEREMSLQINNIVDPNLMGQYLISRPGQALILNVIAENPYKIKRSLKL